MKIHCKNHPKAFIERICASSTCKRDPALCWECMIDEADHARNHRDVMINLDEFAERLDGEFKSLVEKRYRDKSQATEGHLQLLENKSQYLETYQQTIGNRRTWCSQVISATRDTFMGLCNKLEADIQHYFDEKSEQYNSSLEFIVQAIQLRYGLAPLPTKEEIMDELKQLEENNKECNTYIMSLKSKLLPPEDLNRNLAFLDTFKDFDTQNELIEELNTQLQELLNEDADKYYEKEPLYLEVMKSVDNQCSVLIDELKQLILCREPILSRHTPKDDLDESLNTLPDGPNSAQKGTIAQKLYDPNLYATHGGHGTHANSPFMSNNNFFDNQTTLKQGDLQVDGGKLIKYVKSIETQQTRGITSILLMDSRTIASGSRDKTIKINLLEQPQQSYSLEGHIDQVTALCLFQDKLLVSGGGNLDSSIIVWSLTNRRMIHRLCGHQSGITSLIELSDKNCILSGSYDNLAIIWNANLGKSVCALKKHTAMVSTLALLKKDIIATGSWDRTIALWQLQFDNEDIVSATYFKELRSEGAVLCMKKLNERCIIYGGTSNKMNVVDWMSGETKQKFSTSQFGICDLIVSDTFLLGLGASDSTLRLWKNNQECEVFKDQQIQINNYNTNPKIIQINRKIVAVVNNNDTNPHFNLFSIE